VPVSKAPDHMDILEHNELQYKLQELLDTRYIPPSVSPWESSVLSVPMNQIL
jgi:hypothetical protein